MALTFPDYNSPSALKAFLDGRGMAMQKKFGQNFLVNGSIRERLLDILEIRPEQPVWEVGPGLGAMTKGILDRGARLTAFEIDRGFSAVLRELFAGNPRFELIEGDARKTWKTVRPAETGKKSGETARPLFFGNLPYNIAAVLLADFITGGMFFPRLLVTVQKEVALRICAAPGSENYSSFSVLCRRFYDSETAADLAPGNFWPQPNVLSRAVLLKKKAHPAVCRDERLFFSLVRALFSSRRKTVKNNLDAWVQRENAGKKQPADSCSLTAFMLQYAGVPENERAENLPPETFCALADAAAESGAGEPAED